MAPRKTKFVTLTLSSKELENFPELTEHQQEKKPRGKTTKTQTNKQNNNLNNQNIAKGSGNVHINLKLQPSVSDLDLASREQSLKPISSHDSQSPSTILNPNTNTNRNDGSKLSSNVRVGISGLSMNTSIVRELDTSKHVVGSWSKYEPFKKQDITTDEKITNEANNLNSNGLSGSNGIEMNNGADGSIIGKNRSNVTRSAGKKVQSSEKTGDIGKSKINLPTVEDLDNVHAVVGMKDIRGYRKHIDKDKQNEIIEKAQQNGRRVVRSFSGYLMLWPSWHKIKDGNLKKSAEYVNEKPVSQSKGNKDSKNNNGKASSNKASVGPDSASASAMATPSPSNFSKGVDIKSDI